MTINAREKLRLYLEKQRDSILDQTVPLWSKTIVRVFMFNQFFSTIWDSYMSISEV